MSQEVARAERRPVRVIEGYVVNARPIIVARKVVRYVMTLKLALRILALIFGAYGVTFLIFMAIEGR